MVWRYAAGVFGLVCGAIVVGIVARYGYITASTEIDGYITAALFAIIATGGMAGHAIAVRVWRVSRLAAVAVGLVSCAALLANLTSSMGFIAGRDNVNEAKRAKVRQQERRDNAALDRLVQSRGWLPKFAPVTDASVTAAREAVSSAAQSREQECKRRGNRCRDREAGEQKARERLVTIENSLALTKKAAELDGQIEAVRVRLDAVKPVKKEHADASALASLFKIPAATAESYRLFAYAAVVELLIVMSLVAFEVLGQPDRQARQEAKRAGRERETKEALVAVDAVATTPAAVAEPKPKQIARRAPKRLTVEKGTIEDFVDACLQASPQGSVPLRELQAAYVVWCEDVGLAAMSGDEFELKFLERCREAGFPCNENEIQFMALRDAA